MTGTLAPLRTADGVDLHVRGWPVPPGVERRGSLLIVHGLGEHCGRYAHVAERLGGLGLEVRGFDLRGHGRSGGPRGGVPSADALLDDVATVFAGLAAEGADVPFLLGHSMGGAIAARAVTGGWVAPRGLILSSPALRNRITRAQAVALKIARALAPDRGFPNGLPVERLSRDPAVVAAYRADPLVHDRITPRLYEFLDDAGAAARRDAARLTVPTLLVVAGADGLVDASGAREFAEALPPGVGTLRWYDGHSHELFNEREPERGQVLDDVARWLDERI